MKKSENNRIVRYGDTEVSVTRDQMLILSHVLDVSVQNDLDQYIIQSPFPLLEVCLEDYGVINRDIRTIQEPQND
jgi:hypothetical protein